MTFSQLLRVLRARFWTVFITVAVVVSLTALVSFLLPKKYTATASVVVDVRSPDAISNLVLPGLATASYMATQLDILFSQKVAIQVVRALDLDKSEYIRQQFIEETGGQGPIEPWLADLLRSYLDVRPSRDSNVLDIGYTAIDPRFAALVANAFADAYIETNLQLRVEPAKQYHSWFDQQIKEQRDALEKAAARLSAFQRESGILATDERLDVENARLAELSSQLVALQTQSADASSRQLQVKGSAVDTLPEVLGHPLIQSLKAEIAKQEAEVERLSARLGPNHPQLERAQVQLDSLRKRLNAEMTKVVGGIGSYNQVSQRRENEIKKALEAQRAKVMATKAKRDELAVLQREVESAQRAYDQVASRLSQTGLESQSNQTNICLLNRALEPNSHSSPKRLLNCLIALVAGLMLGTGIGLMREAKDRRVRSREDLRTAIAAPTLAIIPRDKRVSTNDSLRRRLGFRGGPSVITS